MFDLPKHLHDWRKKHGLTSKEAAKALGLHPRRLEKYEQGTRTLRDLALEGLLARMDRVGKELGKKPR